MIIIIVFIVWILFLLVPEKSFVDYANEVKKKININQNSMKHHLNKIR